MPARTQVGSEPRLVYKAQGFNPGRATATATDTSFSPRIYD
jgi:hypothetical protein